MSVRVNSGRPGLSHENGPPRLAIDIGANTRHATVTMSTPLNADTVCAQPRVDTTRGALANNLSGCRT